MKTAINYLFLFLFLTSVTFASLFVIFSLGAKAGALAAIFFVFLCLIFFCLSIFGIVKGNLLYLKLRNRLEVVGLMAFSIFLAISIGLASFANAVIEIGMEESGLDAEEKTRYLASTFFKVPSQKNLLAAEKNGISYFYPEESESKIDEFDLLIDSEKARFDHLFGDGQMEELTIEIYGTLESLQSANPLEDVQGYYSEMNQTLYLSSEENWQEVLLHEYTHYRIDQFSVEHNREVSRIPQWFQEGTAEYMSSSDALFHGFEYMETVDFRLLDSNDSFHDAGPDYFDPYLQSYLAVKALVEEQGEEIIPDLLLSSTIDEFYQRLEAVTQKDLDAFQVHFLKEAKIQREKIDSLFGAAYQAMEMEEYSRAEAIANEIKESAGKYDREHAELLLKDIYLEKGLYEEAAAILENKEPIGEGWSEISDLLLLTEIYLLIDTEIALEKFQLAEEKAETDAYRVEDMAEMEKALEIINSKNPEEGYNMLFDKELILQENVRKDLLEQIGFNDRQ